MRRILLLAHRVPVDGAFSLNDLAGAGGRMDEVARAVSTAFTLSNDLRRDVEMSIVFSSRPPPEARRILLLGQRLRYLNPDERSTAALLKNALTRSLVLEHEIEASPGLKVGPIDPMAELDRFVTETSSVWLSEEGRPLSEMEGLGRPTSVVLADPEGPSPSEVERLTELGLPRISLGLRSLRSSQCLTIVHHEWDRWESGEAAAR